MFVALAFVSPAAAQECVNVNTASPQELQRIIHIGSDRAAEIIRLRPFSSVDDLQRVTGIGPARLADIKAQGLACVSGGSAPSPSPAPTPPAPTPSPAPTPAPVTADRVTLTIVAREVIGDSLRVQLSSGDIATIRSTDLVYVRDEWPHWRDDDGDCQDARQEVLIAESQTTVTLDAAGCRVLSGRWVDPLSGEVFTDPAALDVDHMVPLANAFRSGAWGWDRDTRTRYANYLDDPWHLVALNASVNRSKGDRGPDEWRPPQQSAWCNYAREWKMVKARWLLKVSETEGAALAEMEATCR
jgi:hypothetical protein